MIIRACMIIMVFLAGCSPEKVPGSEVVSPEKMQAVLWDVVEADVHTFTTLRTDSSSNPARENARLQETIFRKHGLTREAYYTSLDYYLAHSEIFIPMLDSVMAHHPAINPVKAGKGRGNRDSLKFQVQ
ncbi:MAG: DUF4296 domain-containing protein [Chitinophagaceae bacterium]|nr:MAG: DUF4296 domain-containing protein [Chitinophagaceae bacterium]